MTAARVRPGGRGRARTGAFVAGLLCANSLPHLATAAAGRCHLTPIGGAESSRGINAAWGAANLIGGLALIAHSARGEGLSAGSVRGEERWDSRLVAFDLGAAVFAAWMAASEATLQVNWSPPED
ncbi:hypothetical protein [Brachybacterium sacelli]|uniref:Uncharacterized protein n=1 Tax=Brachybacterium sacelli TaxID=173364 RepID=A0ABS4X542_9MICO|nr:hypothetical protein [Brachybacterium sacelli]MBP2383363.1 hypothetical protein [Brachybacterium sacelli]